MLSAWVFLLVWWSAIKAGALNGWRKWAALVVWFVASLLDSTAERILKLAFSF